MSFAHTLRHKVRIEAPGEGSNAEGDPVGGWTLVAQPYADIRGAGGLETIKGGAEASVVKRSIRIRYRTDVHAGMRVVHGAMVYNIKAVLPDLERQLHTDLVCEVVS